LTVIYGIPNCDTCRAARKWLDKNAIEHEFNDFHVDGLELQTIYGWANQAGWEKLLNTRSQTWRKISQAERDTIDAGRAMTLMFEQPTLIKRPVLVHREKTHIGFSADQYAALFRQPIRPVL
jgi:arsenate reductase